MYLQDLVLLQHFSRKIERKIFRVNNTLDKSKPFRNQFLTIIRNKHPSNVKFDIILLLLGLEQIKRSSFRNKQNSTEFQLSFNTEMFNSQMIFPIIRQTLVETAVFFLGDFRGITCPQWFCLVEFFNLFSCFFDFFGLFLLFFFLVDFFNLRFLVLVFLFFLFFLFRVFNFFLDFFEDDKLDGIGNEFRVFLDNVLDLQNVRLVVTSWRGGSAIPFVPQGIPIDLLSRTI